MPQFKSTYNILVNPQHDDVFDPKWMNSDKAYLPPSKDWDYSYELQITDVDIWEVMIQASGGVGIYAAWSPYAEFYLITTGINEKKLHDIETYYGPGAQQKVFKRAKELGLNLKIYNSWVDNDKLWLYSSESNSNSNYNN